MKSTFKIGLILIGLICLGLSNSCTKLEDETQAQTLTYATITGNVMANLDLSNDTTIYGTPEIQWEKVPSGTLIFARINSEDLDPNMSDDQYQDILFETSVDNSGVYEMQVYAGAGNVTVALFADDFTHSQKVNDSTFRDKIFTYQSQNLTVIRNITKSNELYFTPN